MASRELQKLLLASGVEVRDAGAVGQGGFAQRAFAQRDLIIREAPVLRLPSTYNVKDEEAPDFHYLSSSFSKCPEEQQRDIELLIGKPRLAEIFQRNCIPIEKGSSRGLFLAVSRFNHSCDPNAFYDWDEKVEKMAVYAVKEINIGEEITVSYKWNVMSKKQRLASLEKMGFSCLCSFCETGEDPEWRAQAGDLYGRFRDEVSAAKHFGDGGTFSHCLTVAPLLQKLLRLVEDNRCLAWCSIWILIDLAESSAAHKDVFMRLGFEDELFYVRKLVQVHELCYPTDHYKIVQYKDKQRVLEEASREVSGNQEHGKRARTESE